MSHNEALRAAGGVAGAVTPEELAKAGEWPFKEAAKLYKRVGGKTPAKGYVLFETGYGPSGLPHIGTFGEAVRTIAVKKAFGFMYPDIPTRLYCISDDMDGLRKVPDNVPQQDTVARHLGKALTSVPDPFDTHESYGAHMNARLCGFLDQFGFEYSFKSATENYKNGVYDDALRAVLREYDTVMNIMLPTLGAERRQTYSPFMPVCPETGRVLQVPTLKTLPEEDAVIYRAEDGSEQMTKVTGGACKLQWKPDWGMRWRALGVDYEMYGKDLKPSADISGRICRAIGGRAPEGMVYELFLDAQGEKISKSKGNGLSLEEWLRYGPKESIAYYMMGKPQTAKRLSFNAIPRAADEYLAKQAEIPGQDMKARAKNHAFTVNAVLRDNPEDTEPPSVSFNLLLNLAAACHAENTAILWGFIRAYAPEATPENRPLLNRMTENALNYYRDFVAPNRNLRAPDGNERDALRRLRDKLAAAKDADTVDADTLQTLTFETGKESGYENLRDWFGVLYQTLLGQESGPRMGSFFALYGVKNSIKMIDGVLSS